ncbi:MULTISPECIES: DUF397 domain-containing protein [Streptomyces rochei group]|uniref:DUF397 domain-containing protein n=1 Tax=Streptomyces plicatus TaxID=1922 RepID=A0ABW1Y3J3_STRPL|nr:DUF397 domain-containing protein [Streptomyces plicatus]GGZ46583.1 hypothetical protein GCM10010301_18760 [Streptomyces plicatus]
MIEQQQERGGPLHWLKSSYSGPDGGNCIEVAADTTRVHVRDSKDPHGRRLRFSSTSWAAFATYAGRAGD